MTLILSLPTWGQAGSEEEPIQEGVVVPGAQTQSELLGGSFGVNPAGDIQGFFIPVRQRAESGLALPDGLEFHGGNGRKTLKGAAPGAAGRTSYVKSRAGRFVAVVARDSDKRTSSTEVYDLGGEFVARLARHVVAVSRNARFAALNGRTQVAEIANGNAIDLAVPGDARDPDVQFAEDSDAFVSTYRREKELHVSAFSSEGRLLWRKAVMAGNEPRVRNTLFSPSGDRVAVVAGELPTDHLTLYDTAGKELWTKDIPPGNYAMSFTADGGKLLLIHRDDHILFRASDGVVLWERPFPLAEIERNGSLIATKIVLSGNKFVVATRSALSADPGKKPHQTTNRISGPDLIYTINETGQTAILLNRPSGTFVLESGRFHFEPIVTIGGEPSKVYYLTSSGLRTKAIR